MSGRSFGTFSSEQFESFSSNMSKNDVSRKFQFGNNNNYNHETQSNYNIEPSQIDERMKNGDKSWKFLQDDEGIEDERVLRSINRINELLRLNEGLNYEINSKFADLENTNNDIENDLKKLKNEIVNNNHNESGNDASLSASFLLQSHNISQDNNYLPTPTEENFNDHKKVELEFNSASTPEIHDLSSSPEMLGSNIEEVEIEIQDKISRMVENNYNDGNIIKLRNIVGTTFEILRYEGMDFNNNNDGNGNGNNNDNGQLMNSNDEVRQKSDVLIDKLYGLVEAFTV